MVTVARTLSAVKPMAWNNIFRQAFPFLTPGEKSVTFLRVPFPV
jgi:hypothetical protein